LTGATGVLGARVLKELLETTSSEIYCLVRAESSVQARTRLLSFLRTYDPEDSQLQEFENRVTVLVGDVTDPTLGMDHHDYQEFAGKIDVTLHVAANTNLFSNFRRMEPINVGGTRNMIRFALQTPQKYLCYVSTYTVMGDKVFDKNLVFKETDLDVGQRFDHMNYQHTKFISENAVHDATSQGLVWNIFRPGQIFGEAATGRYPQGQTNVGGLFYDIFKTIIESRVALYCETHYDIVPVDYVSRALVHLALNRNSYFETYHLTNPDIKTYSDVVRLVTSLGYEIQSYPQKEYKEILFEGRMVVNNEEYKSVTTKAFKWWLQKEKFDFSESALTLCTYTYDILKSAGILCPEIDQKLIAVYIDAGVRMGYFPAPPPHIKRVSAVLEYPDNRPSSANIEVNV